MRTALWQATIIGVAAMLPMCIMAAKLDSDEAIKGLAGLATAYAVAVLPLVGRMVMGGRTNAAPAPVQDDEQ